MNATGNTQASLEKSLSTESELVEFGSKASLLDNKVFLSGSVFQQTRQAPQLVGDPIGSPKPTPRVSPTTHSRRGFDPGCFKSASRGLIRTG